ncbi:hypothetical protein ANN_26764 [Periplaneta americana]|uniref:Uncharacterized protein n=1 Tax=Periplaneta americana TaxID=6978 RepID=A0ABQ8RZA4_PERAM|nr:hypothetical protein ANN_26764 [Periplaneta americana]
MSDDDDGDEEKRSDGASSQYKNRKNFINLYYHEEEFGIKAEWHFFATSHGKGSCDGIGGTIKRQAARASLQRPIHNQITTPFELFQWAAANLTTITFCYVSKEDYAREAKELVPRFERPRTVQGTLPTHACIPVSKSKLVTKTYSSVERDVKVLCKKIATFEEEIAVDFNSSAAVVSEPPLVGAVEGETSSEDRLQILTGMHLTSERICYAFSYSIHRSELGWGEHVTDTAGKARRALNFVMRVLRKDSDKSEEIAYKSLVRPVMEYGAACWDPYRLEHIKTLENIQKWALKFCRNNSPLKWDTLTDRRTRIRLCAMFKTYRDTRKDMDNESDDSQFSENEILSVLCSAFKTGETSVNINKGVLPDNSNAKENRPSQNGLLQIRDYPSSVTDVDDPEEFVSATYSTSLHSSEKGKEKNLQAFHANFPEKKKKFKATKGQSPYDTNYYEFVSVAQFRPVSSMYTKLETQLNALKA